VILESVPRLESNFGTVTELFQFVVVSGTEAECMIVAARAEAATATTRPVARINNRSERNTPLLSTPQVADGDAFFSPISGPLGPVARQP
jgi:hypothetical protein